MMMGDESKRENANNQQLDTKVVSGDTDQKADQNGDGAGDQDPCAFAKTLKDAAAQAACSEPPPAPEQVVTTEDTEATLKALDAEISQVESTPPKVQTCSGGAEDNEKPCGPTTKSPTLCKAKGDGKKAEEYSLIAERAELQAKKKIKIATIKKKRAMVAKARAIKLFKEASTEANKKAKEKTDAVAVVQERKQQQAISASADVNVEELQGKVEEARKKKLKAQSDEKHAIMQGAVVKESMKAVMDAKCQADCEAKQAMEAVVEISNAATNTMNKLEKPCCDDH
jgi:translation elongation factor EF-1beta